LHVKLVSCSTVKTFCRIRLAINNGHLKFIRVEFDLIESCRPANEFVEGQPSSSVPSFLSTSVTSYKQA
jgi:hypothetical protein